MVRVTPADQQDVLLPGEKKTSMALPAGARGTDQSYPQDPADVRRTSGDPVSLNGGENSRTARNGIPTAHEVTVASCETMNKRRWHPLAVAVCLTSLSGCARDPSYAPSPPIPDSAIVTGPVTPPVEIHGQLQVVGTNLVDASGTPVQLKGVSSMWLNWASRPFAESKGALEFMRDNWKLSVIRASMGTEAQNGYLAGNRVEMQRKVETIVENAIATGVYVLVDWHTEMAVDQQADAIAFFTTLAQKYGTYPNVIWEPYNEPNGYTWDQIKPYHEAVVDAIRAVDPDNVIVMGTPRWSQDVDVAALNPVSPTSGTANLMYTLHFYACTHNQSLRDKANAAIAKGLALFVTEFGATPADGGVPSKGDDYVCRDDTNLWFDWMSLHSIGGVAWKLDQCADTSCILTSAAPTAGPWTDDYLTNDLGSKIVSPGVTQGGGHGLFVVDWLRQ
jgi:endoglucanase